MFDYRDSLPVADRLCRWNLKLVDSPAFDRGVVIGPLGRPFAIEVKAQPLEAN